MMKKTETDNAAKETGKTRIVRDLPLLPGEPLSALPGKAAKKAGLRPDSVRIWRILRRSLDARKKNNIRYTCTVEISDAPDAFGEGWIPGAGAGGSAVPRRYVPPAALPAAAPAEERETEKKSFCGRDSDAPSVEGAARPVIVGFGPAGMFAGLTLARAGLRPLILERGEPVEARTETVEKFRETGVLNPESNAQFGEGGAGTFSDGKLNTGTHDSRIGAVLLEFYRHGAPEAVLYEAKPHIGTDVLVSVVKNIREEILALGGEILFGRRLEDLITEETGGVRRLTGILVRCEKDGTTITVPCNTLILAAGHSARDTFEMLYRREIPMTRKAFSMGARIEHLQEDVDRAQYGVPRQKDGRGRSRRVLPAADYSLSVHLPDGSSAYTFCMCPGGYVFAAASEEGGLCTNGMSYSGRGGSNANAALLVTLQPEDFPGEGVLAGMFWQREIERKAYSYSAAVSAARPTPYPGAYLAPCQLVGDFLEDRPSTGPGRVQPTYLPGVVWGDLRRVLPEKITSVMAAALPELDKKLAGFASPDAVLTGPETRSSSPVRILRDTGCMSAVEGLFPSGEGAGYAGGITSAAVDGIRCGEAVLRRQEELLRGLSRQSVDSETTA